MEKNHSSNPSMCKKIRAAIATSPAFRAFYRVSSHHHRQESRPSWDSPPAPQTKSSLPQNPRGNYYSTEGAGMIPIKYDYSTTTAAKVGAAKPPAKASPLEAQNGDGKNFESVFTDYLERNKQKIRTVSNAGMGQSIKPAPEEDYGAEKKDSHNHKDHFTAFIERAKKKIRTTSNVGKTSSFRRG
ncbi:hypothetical protein L6164_010135 [Bauhinia variegata]|uniref:Uncharacterized protein n=1 Tax=Bauhinia variegata TaxID=167791 RepID=A0ACB9PLW6_BAUVA|nr:hypothetical protein L6164_010135 [Bauhinia variegata]